MAHRFVSTIRLPNASSTITGNRIANSGSYGLESYDSSSRLTITGNTFARVVNEAAI
jgi:parallel beta-helix repeat protein